MEADEHEKRDLRIIIDESEECDFWDCCEYGEYNECYNASHVLCRNYEVYKKAFEGRFDRFF